MVQGNINYFIVFAQSDILYTRARNGPIHAILRLSTTQYCLLQFSNVIVQGKELINDVNYQLTNEINNLNCFKSMLVLH